MSVNIFSFECVFFCKHKESGSVFCGRSRGQGGGASGGTRGWPLTGPFVADMFAEHARAFPHHPRAHQSEQSPHVQLGVQSTLSSNACLSVGRLFGRHHEAVCRQPHWVPPHKRHPTWCVQHLLLDTLHLQHSICLKKGNFSFFIIYLPFLGEM